MSLDDLLAEDAVSENAKIDRMVAILKLRMMMAIDEMVDGKPVDELKAEALMREYDALGRKLALEIVDRALPLIEAP